MKTLPREQRQRALSAVPEQTLTNAINSFPKSWNVQPRVVPQSGLGLLQLRETALNDAFYLGEFPLATCWLQVITEDGEQVDGAALIMDDQLNKAEQLAFCDAVLVGNLPGWEIIAGLVEEGESNRQQLARERKAILARTRVDFSLLDDVGGDYA